VARALLAKALPIAQLGLRPGFQVLDEHARAALWTRVIEAHKLDIKYAAKLAQRMAGLRRGVTRWGQMKAEDDLVTLAALAKVEKIRCNAVDFDDLIDHTVTLLPELRTPLKWLVVDEFQDCEPRELDLLRGMRGPDTQLFAVGDPHQVIYAWRGSTPALFDTVQAEFACTPYSLPCNYRSTQVILGAARAVLGLQADSGTGALHGTRDQGERIAIRKHHNVFVEALYLGERMAQLHAGGLPWREMAVLFRTRKQVAAVRDVLLARGIPLVESKRAGLHDLPAAEWLLRLLRAALHPDDAGELRAALTDERYGVMARKHWNLRTFEKYRQGSLASGLNLARAFLASRTPADSAERRSLEEARDLCERLQTLAQALLHTADPAGEAFAHLELVHRLRPTSAQHARDVADARRLLRCVGAWCQAEGGPLADSLPRALEAVAMGGLVALAEVADSAADGVRLLTLHAAKGLEFRQVFISGLNLGLLPLQGAQDDPAAEAEERRLLFVGLTRARDHVELSYHTQTAHPQAMPLPSPYLYRIPAALAVWHDGSEVLVVAPEPAVAPASVAVPPPADAPFQVGQAVRHARYGAGTVLSLEGGDITCDFQAFGERSFSLRLCPLAPA